MKKKIILKKPPKLDEITKKIQGDKQYLEFFDLLMRLEGVSSDHPHDKGGHTVRGVTLATWRAWKGDVNATFEKSSIGEFKQLYYEEYFTKVPRHVKQEIHYNTFDICVNSGQKIANNFSLSVKEPIDCYVYRTNFYRKVLLANSSQYVFFKGWLNRLNTIAKYFESENCVEYMRKTLIPYQNISPKMFIFQAEREVIAGEKLYS